MGTRDSPRTLDTTANRKRVEVIRTQVTFVPTIEVHYSQRKDRSRFAAVILAR